MKYEQPAAGGAGAGGAGQAGGGAHSQGGSGGAQEADGGNGDGGFGGDVIGGAAPGGSDAGAGGGSTDCPPGTNEACYDELAYPDTRGVGACADGTRTCSTEGVWGECEGAVTPALAENCSTPEIDEDCSGLAGLDPACLCVPGTQGSCYDDAGAHPNTRGKGICTDGIRTCDANGLVWGPCSGETFPSDSELCPPLGEDADEDCDGLVDEICSCEPNSPTSCTTTQPGRCAAGTATCKPDGTGLDECIANQQPDPEGEDCLTPDIDDDCDRSFVPTGGRCIVDWALGEHHSCALTAEHEVYCWGKKLGAVGGNTTNLNFATPTSITATQIDSGAYHNCAILTSTGQVACWGSNDLGKIAAATGSGVDTKYPESNPYVFASDVLGEGESIIDIALGAFHSCAINAPGTIQCWGQDVAGQLGDGTTNNQPSVTIAGTGYSNLVAGKTHSCAVKAGALYCWGDNVAGQVGVGGTSDVFSPTAVATNSAPTLTLRAPYQVALGSNFSCAVFDVGDPVNAARIACWGVNAYKQLGVSRPGIFPAPDGARLVEAVPEATAVVDIAAGSLHTCAILNVAGENKLWCWGSNGYGQLGRQTTQNSYGIPTDTPNGLPAEPLFKVGAGAYHTCVSLRRGGAYCFGSDGEGQLGDGGTTSTGTYNAPPNVVRVKISANENL